MAKKPQDINISNSLIESESLQRETVGFFAASLIIDQFANFKIENQLHFSNKNNHN